jgi:hypothetical protein
MDEALRRAAHLLAGHVARRVVGEVAEGPEEAVDGRADAAVRRLVRGRLDLVEEVAVGARGAVVAGLAAPVGVEEEVAFAADRARDAAEEAGVLELELLARVAGRLGVGDVSGGHGHRPLLREDGRPRDVQDVAEAHVTPSC